MFLSPNISWQKDAFQSNSCNSTKNFNFLLQFYNEIEQLEGFGDKEAHE